MTEAAADVTDATMDAAVSWASETTIAAVVLSGLSFCCAYAVTEEATAADSATAVTAAGLSLFCYCFAATTEMTVTVDADADFSFKGQRLNPLPFQLFSSFFLLFFLLFPAHTFQVYFIECISLYN